MKKLIYLLLIISGSVSCASEVDKACGTDNGNQLYLGPKGGCYYNNSNGNKTYVDRSFCKC